MNAPQTHLRGAPVFAAAQSPVDAVAQPTVSFRNVGKTYRARGGQGEVVALDAINLDVPNGAIVGVIGRSGAGKSTLIRLVNGLERPTSGQVVVAGTDITGLDEAGLRRERRSIGMIFQHFNLLARRTAFQNVALPLEIAGVSRAEIKARVAPLLDLVGLADKSARYPAELSGGQKQRVGIARALATNPRVLLSDEATSALDPETTEQILDLLRKVNAELKLTVLLITHEMAVIKSVADRVAVIEGGRIVEDGPTFELFTNPKHPTTASFVSAITGAMLPEDLQAKLRPEPIVNGKALVRLVFNGPNATAPILSRLSRELGVDLSIIQAQFNTISGRPFGVLTITAPAQPPVLDAVVKAARDLQLGAEVLGYVV